MSTKPKKNNQESESLQEQIIKLQKQLESFKHSNDHFLKNKLFLHYDIKEPEKVVVDCETKLPVLAEVEKKNIQKGSESDPIHLIIEGDNYHALSVLNYTHAGKIDLIYIDPPYNTGNKDFIYNDRFVDREDSFRHSKWLSFMGRRLRLAKDLLSETGVIFISIDDNEQAHLRLLCDQIFGEENFVNQITIKTNETKGLKNSAVESRFPKNKEYVLVYAKIAYNLKFNIVKSDKDEDELIKYVRYYNKYIENIDEDINKWKICDFDQVIKANPSKNILELKKEYANKLFYLVSPDNEIKLEIKNKHFARKINRKEKEVIYFNNDGKINTVLFLKDNLSKNLGDLWTDISTININKENAGLPTFTNGQKPLKLLERILEYSTKNNSTVLDFFAGSGTTGHAVLKLNAQDSGTRQFILCTNNENKIAEEVTYPRIKKVIGGYADNAPIPANLRYFQTDFVEKKGSTSQLKIDLTRQCAEMLCVKENVFEAVKTKKSAKNYKFFKNGNKYLGVFFDFFTDPEFTDFIAELNKLPQEAEKAVYIFVLDGSASIFAEEFAGVANCEIKEIPQKILDIYKQLAREVARK